MKNSIKDLRSQLTSREKLTTQQLITLKGGKAGEDLRKPGI